MRTIYVIMLVLFSVPVKAGNVDNLIKLIGIESMLEKAYEECLRGSQSLLSEELRIESQAKTLGINPEHKYWGELEKIFKEFYEASCEFVSVEESKKIWHAVYANGLSKKEIAELVEFYSGSVGKKIVELDIKANTRHQVMTSNRYAKYASKARRVYEYRINKLIQKIESEKHNQALQRTQSLTRLVR
ncbi:MAG: DUF2059 domain-containing protein [Candidatus Thiodiazotropha sp. (ex Lucinoma borealis)]|nr:DUF2059 domain-containing protein [Candidatus Thiodiazotropha sp. (ex Lucinoma borealis)]